MIETVKRLEKAWRSLSETETALIPELDGVHGKKAELALADVHIFMYEIQCLQQSIVDRIGKSVNVGHVIRPGGY